MPTNQFIFLPKKQRKPDGKIFYAQFVHFFFYNKSKINVSRKVRFDVTLRLEMRYINN